MTCPDCGGRLARFRVPEAYHDDVPDEAMGLCARCLNLVAVEDAPADHELELVSEAFREGGAVEAALVVGLLDHLALNRPAIERLLAAAEREGCDVFLLLGRLASQGNIDARYDVPRRRHQLEQFVDRD